MSVSSRNPLLNTTIITPTITTTATAIDRNNYVIYLLEIQYFISITIFSIATVFWFKTINEFIVKMRSTVIRYTPCIALFLLVGDMSSIGSILHLLYMAIMWRPNGKSDN